MSVLEVLVYGRVAREANEDGDDCVGLPRDEGQWPMVFLEVDRTDDHLVGLAVVVDCLLVVVVVVEGDEILMEHRV